jgi:hypothetical protein
MMRVKKLQEEDYDAQQEERRCGKKNEKKEHSPKWIRKSKKIFEEVIF